MAEVAIDEALETARQRLQHALAMSGRSPQDAQLLAVSKTKPIAAIREAYRHGQRAFGENYLQEALDKQQALSDLDLEWHFIGPLQSNKTRLVAENFAWMHSLDRDKIARRLSDQRPARLPALNICLQVNISGEESKAGVTLDDLDALADSVVALPRLALRGLMAIPAPCSDPARQGEPFARLRHALESLKARHPDAPLDTLSMGMSNDLESAVAEGATLVRLGTAIFGSRSP